MVIASKNKDYDKSFYLLWLSDFIASIGHGISSFALSVYVFHLTNLATSVSMVMLAAFLPSLLLTPFAGVLADRYDRRLLLILGDGISGLSIFIMFLLYRLANLTLWHIYVCVAFSSIFTSLIQPAMRATVTDLVPPENFTKAASLFQLSQGGKFLISPFISGLLMKYYNLSIPLLIDVLTIVFTILAVCIIRKQIGKPETKKIVTKKLKEDFMEGWTFVKDNQGILVLMLLVTGITFYLGFLQTLFTPMMLSIADEKTLGMVQSIAATGILISSVLLNMFHRVRNHLKMLSLALTLTGTLIILLGLTTNIMTILIIVFLFFCSLPPANASIEVLMRSAIPNETQGRVWGILSTISQTGYLLAYAVAGPLADLVNPLFVANGKLSETILGSIIGVGPGRGIGLLFVISGIFILIISNLIHRIHSIRVIQENFVISSKSIIRR